MAVLAVMSVSGKRRNKAFVSFGSSIWQERKKYYLPVKTRKNQDKYDG
ncbi:MAG: hypothetical protein P9L92_18175 [Candidatus Electryonea clarkiae]|nr:hypothetical protein [Candidatus Electryonea clarkiae]